MGEGMYFGAVAAPSHVDKALIVPMHASLRMYVGSRDPVHSEISTTPYLQTRSHKLMYRRSSYGPVFTPRIGNQR